MGRKLGNDYVVAFDIIQEVDHLREINVVGETYKISFYLGGDWKFLAVVTGIDAASSDYACISCKCWKEDRSDITQWWSIKNVSSGARTTEENKELAGRPHVRKVYNVSHEPVSHHPLVKCSDRQIYIYFYAPPMYSLTSLFWNSAFTIRLTKLRNSLHPIP